MDAGDGAPIRVLLIARHALVRDGLRLLLADDPQIAVVGAVARAADLTLVTDLGGARGVDVVVLDTDQVGGTALVQRVRALAPGAGVVALGLRGDDVMGADRRVGKSEAASALASAIRAAAGGELPCQIASHV